jgi:hypothetical protein
MRSRAFISRLTIRVVMIIINGFYIISLCFVNKYSPTPSGVIADLKRKQTMILIITFRAPDPSISINLMIKCI